MSLQARIESGPTDRRQADLTPIVERCGGTEVREPRLSPMARRVQANKAEGLRTGGERPMGADSTAPVAA